MRSRATRGGAPVLAPSVIQRWRAVCHLPRFAREERERQTCESDSPLRRGQARLSGRGNVCD